MGDDRISKQPGSAEGASTGDPVNEAAVSRTYSVTVALIEHVLPGQRIWAHNDGDWLKVHEIEIDAFGDVIVYRLDRSEASFAPSQRVLVRQ